MGHAGGGGPRTHNRAVPHDHSRVDGIGVSDVVASAGLRDGVMMSTFWGVGVKGVVLRVGDHILEGLLVVAIREWEVQHQQLVIYAGQVPAAD